MRGGEGNNTAAALALVVAAGKRAARGGAVIDRRDSAADLPSGVDAVCTTRWQTAGTSKPDAAWRERFRASHVDEVTGAVLDGPRSVARTQASMKLCSAMAVLAWALGPHEKPDA